MQTSLQPTTLDATLAQAAEAAAAAAAAASAVAGRQTAVVVDEGAGAIARYEAAAAVRSELRSQLSALVSQRHSIVRELEDHDVEGPATLGMQQRIVQLDGRIAELDIAIAQADAAVAAAAAVPGAVVPPPPRDGPPKEIFVIVPLVVLVAMLPVIIATALRIWKKGSRSPAQLPADFSDRLVRIEQLGEATALEVERIGEGQRFVTRILADQKQESDQKRVGAARD